jgi:beta-glucuronidase
VSIRPPLPFRFIPAILSLFCASLAAPFAPAGADTLLLRDNWQFRFVGTDSSDGFATAPLPRGSRAVTLPHLFPRTGAGGSPAAGFGWYTADIDVPRSFAGKDVALEFDGVCLFARVFIDGAAAGGGDFPWLPFTVDCTPFLAGKTRIRCAVRVDDRLVPGRIPDDKALGWRIYGGIDRPVRLVAKSRDRIARAELRTFCRGSGIFDLSVHAAAAHAPWDSLRLFIAPPDRALPCVRATMRGGDSVLQLHGIRPWSPESPCRYRISLVPFFHGRAGDTLDLRRGFCQLTTNKTRLLLNGAPCYLCGMGRHDMLGDRGPLLTREQRRADLVDLKSLGVNFLRIAHFPQDRDVYELCDSLGLLVMDEIPAWKTSGSFLGSAAGYACGRRYLQALIEAHGNYSCVGLWSIGNQLATFAPAAAGFIRAVAPAVKRADSSRLVTFCSYYYQLDRAFPFVDVISVNEYFGWELASLPLLGPVLDGIHAKWPDKPLLISEFGAQAAPGLRNGHPRLAGIIKSMVAKDLSEDHQALFLGAHMDTIWGKRSYVNGMVVWAYADYFSNLHKARTRSMPVGLNACGVVTADRKRKLSCATVRDHYGAFAARFAGKAAPSR